MTVVARAGIVSTQTKVKQIAADLILRTLLVPQNYTIIATIRKLHRCYFNESSKRVTSSREDLRRTVGSGTSGRNQSPAFAEATAWQAHLSSLLADH